MTGMPGVSEARAVVEVAAGRVSMSVRVVIEAEVVAGIAAP
jgi:hypothetical protein